MLRPALELSWAVAKVGSQARPPLRVPGRLRPIMRVARLPDRMLETVRQVVEDDDEFRERVVTAAEESDLGRPSWLWLVRPDGWEAELAELVQQAAGAESLQQEKRDALAAARQLAEVTSNLRRLQAELVALKTVNEELREAAARHRQDNRASESEAADLRRQLRDASVEIDRLRRLNDGLDAAVSGHRDEMKEASGQRSEDLRRLAESRDALRAAEASLEDAELRARLAEAEVSRLRARLSRAETGARALADEIGGTAAPGAGAPGAAGDTGEEEPSSGRATGTPAPTPAAPNGARISRGRRVPVRLPPATFEDSPEAAAHLVRVPGVLLAVDGYNVTLRSWPSLDLPAQRDRLIDSLTELVMRAGTDVLVVFDGVDDGNRLRPAPAVSRKLKVQFSPSEIEADDVLIGTVESAPLERPVVVATNDQRVRRATARMGANVISVDQLLAVLGRGGAG